MTLTTTESLADKFCREVNRLYECRICGKRFESKRQFYFHWEAESWHEDEAAERMVYREDVKPGRNPPYVVRPVEKELFDIKINSDRDKYRLRKGVNATQILLNEIRHSVEHDEMIVIECIGRQGSGKSVTMLALARYIQLQWHNKFKEEVLNHQRDEKDLYVPKIYISSNLAETLEYTNIARMGDIIIQDEDPTVLGSGSGMSKSQIENILKIMRARCVHYIFVSPVSVPYVDNVNCILETYAKDVKHRVTKLILYDRLQHALGWVEIKILPDDDPLMRRYLKKKMRNIDDLVRRGLAFSAKPSPTKLKSDIDRMIESLLELFGDRNTLYGLDKTFLRRHAFTVIDGTIEYQNYIADRVYIQLQKELLDREYNMDYDMEVDLREQTVDIVEKCGITYKWVKFRTENVIDMMVWATDELATEVYKDNENMLRGALAFNLHILQGMSQKDSAREINIRMGSTRDTTMYFRRRTKKDVGYIHKFIEAKDGLGTLVEIAVQKFFYPRGIRKGGQSEDDIYVEDEDLHIEVKVRSDSRKPEQLVGAHVRELINSGANVVFVIVRYDTKSAIADFYKVEYISVEDSDISEVVYGDVSEES